MKNPDAGMNTNGDRLKSARRAAGYTKAFMAECLGVPRRQYAAYEAGAPMPMHKLMLVCAVTRCSLTYFQTGEGFERHSDVYLTVENVATKLNMCGRPCTVGPRWCTEECLKD